jgi:hypothetical protein
MKNGLRTCEAQPAEAVEEAAPSSAAPSNPLEDAGLGGLGGLADTLRNMGGGGAGAGAGGMPDLASMMSNPAVMQMAQQMMANGGLERLMSNQGVSNMVSGIDSSRCVDISPYVACSFYPDGPVEQWRQFTIHGRPHDKSRITTVVSSPIDNKSIFLNAYLGQASSELVRIRVNYVYCPHPSGLV